MTTTALPAVPPGAAAPPATFRPHNLLRGAGLMVVSALMFAGMSASVKAAEHSLPNVEVVFFRNVVGLALLLPWLARRGPGQLRTGQLGTHLVRGLAGLGAMYCFFYAIGHMRLADAVLLNYSLPLLLPFIERVWLGEAIRSRLWWPLGVGFAGILLILRPGTDLFEPAALLAVAAAALAALAQVGVRSLTRTEPVMRIVFYFALISSAVSALPLALGWSNPGPAAWVALIAAGVLATLGQTLLTAAYAAAPAAWVGPYLYTSVVFSGLLDWLIWGILPDLLFLLGATLVVAAGVLTLRLRHADLPAAGTPAQA